MRSIVTLRRSHPHAHNHYCYIVTWLCLTVDQSTTLALKLTLTLTLIFTVTPTLRPRLTLTLTLTRTLTLTLAFTLVFTPRDSPLHPHLIVPPHNQLGGARFNYIVTGIVFNLHPHHLYHQHLYPHTLSFSITMPLHTQRSPPPLHPVTPIPLFSPLTRPSSASLPQNLVIQSSYLSTRV